MGSSDSLAPPMVVVPFLRRDDVSEADHERLGELYRAHRHGLGRQILAITGEPHVVDDLVNETFVLAFETLRAFEGRSCVRTWLRGIASNVARNYVAKKYRRRSIDQRREQCAPPSPSAAIPDEEVQARQSVAALYEGLASLPTATREAFVLNVIECHPMRDVAARLGLSLSAVQRRVRTAEAHLRAMLDE